MSRLQVFFDGILKVERNPVDVDGFSPPIDAQIAQTFVHLRVRRCGIVKGRVLNDRLSRQKPAAAAICHFK